MPHTTEDFVNGLKFLKQAIRKTPHRACHYFHFTPTKVWVFDGEFGASIELRTGITGKVEIAPLWDIIKNWKGEVTLPYEPMVQPADFEYPFPTDSQFSFCTDQPFGISEALKEGLKQVPVSSWISNAILLGETGLVLSDGTKKFVWYGPKEVSSGHAAVIPERFASLVSRLGDPDQIKANGKFTKASYSGNRCLYAKSSGVIASDVFQTHKNLLQFSQNVNPVFIIDGKVKERVCCDCVMSYQCDLKTNRMSGTGANGQIMFVGKHPGRDDDSIGSPMTGPNGQLFWELLRDSGFQRGEVFVTNCIKCAPLTQNAGKKHWASCQKYFLKELEEVKPKMIVAVGAEATEFLTGRTGVMGLRGTGMTCVLDENYVVYPIRQPMALEHAQPADRPALKQSMIDDLRTVRDILHNGGKVSVDTLEDDTDYQIARTPEDVDRFLEELDKFDELSCDIETNDKLDPNDPLGKIVAIGFSGASGMGRAIPIHANGPLGEEGFTDSPFWWETDYVDNHLIPKLRDFCRRKKIYGHNFIKFDAQWLAKRWELNCDHIEFDTLLGAYATFHGLKSYGLEVLANSRCGMRNWKKEFDWTNTEKLCQYLCKDVDATVRVKLDIEKNIDQLEMWLLKNILIPIARELALMEGKGVTIDKKQIDALDSLLSGKLKECLSNIRATKEVTGWEMERGIEFNPESVQHTREIMFEKLRLKVIKRTDTKLPSVDAEVMETYAAEHPFARYVTEYKKLSKLHGTYVEGILKRLVDGLIHTSYLEHRTVTGRLASQNPNLQNIPREDTAAKVLEDGADIKRMFVPRQGTCFLQADYSQIELRVLACVAHDENMIRLFNSGADIHRETAAQACGISPDQVTKAQRTGAKFLNFGIVYGMTLPTLEVMFEESGTSAAEARRFWEGHQKAFPAVWRYMEEQKQKVIREGQQTTYFGRTRVYDTKDEEAFRQAYNFPIQSTASDLTLLSIIRTGGVLRQMGRKAYPILTVHDSIIYEVELSQFWDVAYIVQHVMESISFPWIVVPIKADLQAGPTWGDLLNVDMEKKILYKEK